ncbi:WD40 repeat domain-containing serine/threonine protein kinase [Streptomyces hydrogenans]|uniref:WD40 repeat domain-containing serine/threonine protein kinase n=1 Tax=Streptomyces hydrogenans TaxID=1873719 RepID=UPI003334545D
MAEPEISTPWTPGRTVDGRYRVVGELGRGGMGVVHRVRHLAWGIDLAVKSPRAEVFRDPGDEELFVREAETWVSLGLHPNVCACHYVRVIEGVPRVFAEYVDGGSLAEWIRDGRLYAGGAREALARVLDVAVQMARGLDHAHHKGLVHQDVKPANVLLDGAGTAKITDFGLARSGRATSTAEPAVVGGPPEASVLVPTGGMTLAYASPEQLAGEAVGRRSDVHSFAVSVLEMVTGGVRWRYGSIAGSVLDEVLADPANPVAAPPELAGLLRRCLRPHAAGRPASMGDIAEVIGEIHETATGSPYPRPVPREARLRADELNNRALSLLDLGREDDAAEALAEALRADPRNIRVVYNDELLRWRRGTRTDEDVITRIERARQDTGDTPEARRLLAQVQVERGELPAARELLAHVDRELPDERGVEAALLWTGSAAVGHARLTAVWNVPWPARPLSELWHPRSKGFGAYESLPVALAEEARLALSGCPDGALRLWDVRGGQCVRTFRGHRREVEAVDLTPDGRHALSQGADGVVRFWNLSGGFLTRLSGGTVLHRGEPRLQDLSGVERVSSSPHRRSVRLTPDGRTAVAVDARGTVRVWDTGDGRLRRTLPGHLDGGGVAVTADGARVIATQWERDAVRQPVEERDFAALVWDVDSGRRLHALTGHAVMPQVLYVAADGHRAVTSTFDELVLWDPRSGRRLRTFTGGHGARAAALSPDGRLLASSGSVSAGVRLWETETGRCLRTYRGHDGDITSVTFTDGGRTLVSAAADRTVRSWSLPGGYAGAPRLSVPHRHAEVSGAGARVDTLLAEAEEARTVRRYDLALERLEAARATPGHERTPRVMTAWRGLARHTRRTGLRAAWPVREFTHPGGKSGPVVLSDDGRLAATGSWDDTARLWDVDTGALLREFTGHADHVTEVRLSEDGDRLLTADSAGTVRLWRTDTGACLRTLAFDGRAPAGTLRPAAACLLPGGSRAVVATLNTLTWWNLHDGGVERTVEDPVGHRGEKVLAVASDGSTVAVGGQGGVRLFDTEDGTVLHTLTDPRARGSFLHENPARLCFTEGGRRLLVAGGMGVGADVIRVWDVATGTTVHEFAAPGACTSLAVTADGAFALSGGTGSHVLAWDVPTGRRLRTFDAHGGRPAVVGLAMTPDGQLAVARTMDETLRVWQLDWSLTAPQPRFR